MLDAKIIEEALKEHNSLNESNEFKKANTQNKSAKQVLFENLLQEMYPMAGYYQEKQTKYTRLRDLLHSLQDAIYKVESCKMDKERNSADADIYDTLSQTYESVINTLISRIGEVWESKESEYEDEEEDKKEEEEEEKEDDEESENSEHPDSQTLMIQLQPNEAIISPQNKEYIIEKILGNMVEIRDISSDERFSVEKDIAIKWKNSRGD